MPRLRAKQTSAEASLQSWYRDYLTEVSDFFRFSQGLQGAEPSTEIPLPADKVSLALQQIEGAILKVLQRFRHTLLSSLRYLALPTLASAPEPAEDEVGENFPPGERGQPRQSFPEPSWNQPSWTDDQSGWEELAQGGNQSPGQRPSTNADLSARGNFRDSLSQRFSRLFEQGRRRFLDQLDGTAQDSQQTRKEVLQQLISAHYEWFVEDLQSTLQQQKKPLMELLRGTQQTLGEQRLAHIQPTLTSPREHLALLTRAEHFLRSNA